MACQSGSLAVLCEECAARCLRRRFMSAFGLGGRKMSLCGASCRASKRPCVLPRSFALLSTGGPRMYDVLHETDIAVIGAGAAGCVMAARLSEDPARRVVLLEAGPDYPTLEHLPDDLRDGWRSAGSHDWSYL